MPTLAIAVTGFAVGLRFVLFVSKYSVNLLFYDQWDFLGRFFEGTPPLLQLFLTQHGPHREGIALVIDWFLYSATNWNVRAEAFLISACILAAMLGALALKRKLFGTFSYSDVAIPLIFMTLVQYETPIGTPNLAYSSLPLLLIMLYLLALVRGGRLGYGLVLVPNFFLIYSGFGIFMGLVTLVIFAWECYRSARGISPTRLALPVAGLLVAAASLASFFLGYVVQGGGDCIHTLGYNPLPYVEFVAFMFANFLAATLPQGLFLRFGAALLLVFGIAFAVIVRRLAKSKDRSRSALVIAALIGFSLLFSANAAIGRACFGLPGAALPSRYTTLLIPAYLGLYFTLLTIPFAAFRGAALLLLVAVLLPGVYFVPPGVPALAEDKRAWVACYLRVGEVFYCDRESHFAVYPDPARTRLAAKLQYLRQRQLSFFADAGPE